MLPMCRPLTPLAGRPSGPLAPIAQTRKPRPGQQPLPSVTRARAAHSWGCRLGGAPAPPHTSRGALGQHARPLCPRGPSPVKWGRSEDRGVRSGSEPSSGEDGEDGAGSGEALGSEADKPRRRPGLPAQAPSSALPCGLASPQNHGGEAPRAPPSQIRALRLRSAGSGLGLQVPSHTRPLHAVSNPCTPRAGANAPRSGPDSGPGPPAVSTPPRPTRAEQHAALCASSRQRHAGGLRTEMTCNQGSRRRQLNDCHRTVLCAGTSALSDLPGGHLRATSSISCGPPAPPSAKPSRGTLAGCHPPPTARARPRRGKMARTGPVGIGEAPGTARLPRHGTRSLCDSPRPPTQRESKRGGKRLTPGTAKLRRRN